jgi:hypothetical protein
MALPVDKKKGISLECPLFLIALKCLFLNNSHLFVLIAFRGKKKNHTYIFIFLVLGIYVSLYLIDHLLAIHSVPWPHAPSVMSRCLTDASGWIHKGNNIQFQFPQGHKRTLPMITSLFCTSPSIFFFHLCARYYS